MLHRNLECQVHKSKQIGSDQTGDGKSEHHQTGLEWVNLTQMTIISTTVSKNPLEEMEQPSQLTKKSKMQCNLKNDRMILVHFQGKPFNITVIQVYALTSNAEEAEVEWFYEDLKNLLELIPKKDVLFIIGDWECKGRKSRATWSSRQIWHWSIK